MTTPDVWMRSVGCVAAHPADGEPDARVDLGGAGVSSMTSSTPQSGDDRGEAALGDDEQERHREARRVQDLAERLRAGQVVRASTKTRSALGRSDQLRRLGGDHPRHGESGVRAPGELIVGRRRQDQELRHATLQ